MESHMLSRQADTWDLTHPKMYPTHSGALIAISVAFLTVTIFFTSVRFFVRGYMIKSLGWDDWLILLALGSFICQAVFLIHLAWMEQHFNLTLVKPLSNALEYVILEFAFYIMTSLFLKLSLAVFFLRIVVAKWQRNTIIMGTTIFSLFTFAFFFVAILQCGDPSQYLLHKVQGKCLPWSVLGPLNYIHGAMNAVTDWVFVSLPILVIRNANMTGRAKWSVVGVLVIGILGSVASVVRLYYIKDIHPSATSATEFFSKASTIAITSIIEIGMGVAAACLATLRPLFKRFLDHTRSYGSSGTVKNNNSSAAERGLSSRTGRGGVSVLQTPRHGDFAQYGFTADDIVPGKNDTHVEMHSLPSGRGSTCDSDEVMVHVQTVQYEQRESQDELLADLQESKQVYSARIWSGKDNSKARP